MKYQKTISVAMCTYNGEAFLKEQLDSIRAQTFPPSELVICDDCSSDATLEILSAFKENCNFPVVIIANTQNMGVSKNFENAIAHCSGEFIALADQDDIWQSTKNEEIIRAFEKNPNCGYVFSNADLIDEQGQLLGIDLWQSIGFNKIRVEKYGSGDQLEVMLKKGNLVYGMTMAFRSSFKSKLFPIESRSFDCVHDTWIALMLSASGAYGVAVPKSLVQYRQHEMQVAGAGRPVKFMDFLKRITTNNRSEENLALADALESISTRLQCEGQKGKQELLAKKLLIGKATHFRARVSANSSHGFERLKIVFGEAKSGRYGQFSKAFKSVLKDLLTSSATPKS